MHPLVARLFWRGPIVVGTLTVAAWAMRQGLEAFLSDQQITVTHSPAPRWLGPVLIGFVGLAVLAICESLAFARGKMRRKPAVS